MKLVELLHLCLIAARTGTVTYRNDNNKGQIYLREGQIKHAEYKELTGEEALYAMLETESGDADYTSVTVPPRVSIAKPCAHVLMEAARRADEKSKTTLLSYPPPSNPSSNNFKPLPLLIYHIANEQRSYTLKPETTRAGRLSENDLPLDHESVSSHHCSFEIDSSGTVMLSDLGSLNGTYVNGKRIQTPVQLREGDTIHVGPIPMRLVFQKTN
ncbi:MAG: FHA domain-containing protein [Methylacidiphilales bacterium]|nr:FHA domain-containing protein [Candidatus Methylacidiphilales bacterium]